MRKKSLEYCKYIFHKSISESYTAQLYIFRINQKLLFPVLVVIDIHLSSGTQVDACT